MRLFFSACSSNMNETGTNAYPAQKAQLAKEEKKEPLSFLKIYASNKKNMFGSTIVKGVVSNSATVCGYKDVRVKLLSFDKEGKMVEEHEDIITGMIAPNANKDFKLRYHLPHSADSVAVSIMSASVAE